MRLIKNYMNKNIKQQLCIITFVVLVSTPSYAYLDPGSLSIAFAFIVSVFTTLLFYIKTIIKFIKKKIFKKFSFTPKSD